MPDLGIDAPVLPYEATVLSHELITYLTSIILRALSTGLAGRVVLCRGILDGTRLRTKRTSVGLLTNISVGYQFTELESGQSTNQLLVTTVFPLIPRSDMTLISGVLEVGVRYHITRADNQQCRPLHQWYSAIISVF